MKQNRIVAFKMWDGINNKKPIVFPTQFYSMADIMEGLKSFDMNNVEYSLYPGVTDKGFPANIVNLELKKIKRKNS
jgi:hypothetical protein